MDIIRYIRDTQGRGISTIPTNELTNDICELAVSLLGTNLIYIPRNLISYKMCILAALSPNFILADIPSIHRTPEICKRGVMMHPFQIRNATQTHKLCKIAVLQDGFALQYIKQEFQSLEICFIAIRQNYKSLKYIKKININHCIYALEISYNAIRFIPIKFHSIILSQWFMISNIYKIPDFARFISNTLTLSDWINISKCAMNVHIFNVIPNEYKTDEVIDNLIMYLPANEQLIQLMKFISGPRSTLERCINILKRNGNALPFIGRAQTEELCLIAVSSCGEALAYCVYRTYDICAVAVAQNGHALLHVPLNIITIKMCYCAIDNDPSTIRYVPRTLLSNEMCDHAFRLDATTPKYFYPEYLNDVYIDGAIRADGNLIANFPQSHERQLIAVRQHNKKGEGIFALNYCRNPSTDVVAEAINFNPQLIDYIPELSRELIVLFNHNAIEYTISSFPHLKEKIKNIVLFKQAWPAFVNETKGLLCDDVYNIIHKYAQ